MKVVTVVTVVVLLAGGLGLGVPASPRPTTAYEDFEARTLAAVHGDVASSTKLVVYHPDGSQDTKVITISRALDLARQVFHDIPAGFQVEDTTATNGIGFGSADPNVRFAMQWPFCDGASIFTSYPSLVGGLSFAKRVHGSPAAARTPFRLAMPQVCNNEYGTPDYWEDVTLDIRGIPGAYRNCADAQVMLGTTGDAFYPRGLLGGVQCGSMVTSARGWGNVATIYGPADKLDVFFGGVAVVKAGDEVT